MSGMPSGASATAGTTSAAQRRDCGGERKMNGNDAPHSAHPRSTAKIADPPIHPMLIPFPIVCFIGTFVADIMYSRNGEPGWATASHWLLGVGLVMAALAAVAGLTDYLGDARLRTLSDALKHMIANVTAVVLEAVNLALRIHDND